MARYFVNNKKHTEFVLYNNEGEPTFWNICQTDYTASWKYPGRKDAKSKAVKIVE